MTLDLIDTHAHLDEEAFAGDLKDVVSRASEAGVGTILTIGTTADSSRQAVAIADRFESVRAVVGIQPNYVAEASPGDWDVIVELADHSQVVGIGESGLDRYWDYAPIELQQDYFDRHIRLSRDVNRPFVVHCREAENDVVDQLRRAAREGPLSGVMHSFCGDTATMMACLELGLHISFAGMLTYRKNDDLRATAAQVPLERLLVETDAPYLAPVPRRGKRNEPALVQHTCACLAEAHNMNAEEMAAIASANARRLFGLNAG